MKKSRKRLVTISILTTLSGAAIYAVNRLISTTSVRKNLLSTEENRYYDWQFGKIFYTRKGTGKPLLLIHDLSCSSSSYEWKNLIDALAETHTVYALDLLGCGRSDKPKITYTNFLYVQLITGFIKTVIGCPADIIASGLSGSFIVTACSTSPECFRKIMLINPEDLARLNRIPDKKSKFVKCMIELPLVGTLLYHTLTARSNMELLFTEHLLYNPFHENQKDIDTYYEAAHRGNGNGKYLLASLVGKYVNLNLTHALKNINHSIYIIGGASEDGIRETLALYTSLNPSVETELIPKSKHLPQLETPVDVLERIRIFF